MKPGKTLINFCPTGMVPTRQMNPYVPISPSEIIEQVHEAWELGITIAHLHARDEDGRPSSSKNIYRDIFEGVRRCCPELIICGSSSGRNCPEFEKRSEVIELRPDMCSLTLSSLNFQQQASINEPEVIVALAEKMNAFGVKPELECFDAGMINFGKYLAKKGLLKPPYYWNLLFGNIAGMQATALQIGMALSELGGEENHIALAGLGKDQLTVNTIAIALGYGVRVGLEDNLWWDDARTLHATNLKLLSRVHNIMELHERRLLTAKEFGKLGFYNEQNVPVGI